LIERIINSHSQVAAGRTQHAAERTHRAARNARMTRGGEWVEQLNALDMSFIGRAYSRVTRETGIPIICRLTDKLSGELSYCGVIRATFPNAKGLSLSNVVQWIVLRAL